MVRGLNLKRKTFLSSRSRVVRGVCFVLSHFVCLSLLVVWKAEFCSKESLFTISSAQNCASNQTESKHVFSSSLLSCLWEVQLSWATAQLVGNSLMLWSDILGVSQKLTVLFSDLTLPLCRQALVTGPALYSLMMADHSWILVTDSLAQVKTIFPSPSSFPYKS